MKLTFKQKAHIGKQINAGRLSAIDAVVRTGYPMEEQLCWSCANAVPSETSGCPWSRHFEPVPGWDAVKAVECGDTRYSVKKCPLFEHD